MFYLKEKEEKEALKYFDKVIEIAKKSTCERAKCGCVIVNSNEIIGGGFNSPPKNLENQRRCSNDKELYHKKVTDKTCCIHAEQRAIFDALKNNPKKLSSSRLYFIRIDENGNPTKSGKPYCTICSKMALDVGISEFVLWHEKGICVYKTEGYNTLSFDFKE